MSLPQITEHHIQAAAFTIIRMRAISDWKYQLIYAIPNGGKRNIGVARKMKAEGQESGVLDINIDVPCGGYPGMRIETKVPGGKLTENQLKFLRLYQKAGFLVFVCTSTQDILSTIESYFKLGESTAYGKKEEVEH